MNTRKWETKASRRRVSSLPGARRSALRAADGRQGGRGDAGEQGAGAETENSPPRRSNRSELNCKPSASQKQTTESTRFRGRTWDTNRERTPTWPHVRPRRRAQSSGQENKLPGPGSVLRAGTRSPAATGPPGARKAARAQPRSPAAVLRLRTKPPLQPAERPCHGTARSRRARCPAQAAEVSAESAGGHRGSKGLGPTRGTSVTRRRKRGRAERKRTAPRPTGGWTGEAAS